MYDIWNKRRKEVSFLFKLERLLPLSSFFVETAVVEKSYTKNFPFFMKRAR